MSPSAGSQAQKFSLPTPPASLFLIVKAAGDPRVSLQALARLIAQEPTLTAELLRVVNSPYFGHGKEVKTVQQAAVMMGMRAIRNLAVAHVVRATAEQLEVGGLDGVRFWEDSLRRAIAARVLAEEAGFEDPLEAFTAGLLQDLGTLALAAKAPEHGAAFERVRGLPAASRMAEEQQLFGTDHAAFFGELAEAWGIPADLAAAVAAHHDPHALLTDRRSNRLMQICRAADAVADVFQAGGKGASIKTATAVLDALPSRELLTVEGVCSRVRVEMIEAGRQLGIEVGKQPTYKNLMQHANSTLLQINGDYEELTRQLERTIAEKEALTAQLQEANAELKRLAETDALTGVANRRHFTNQLEAALAGQQGPVSLVMLDLDHFKSVNDTYGHAAGDDVLVETCRRLGRCLREQDVLGRVGGVEFAVLLPDTAKSYGTVVAERLRAALQAKPVRTRDGVDIPVTGSFGGVTVQPYEETTSDAVLQTADEGLYHVKETGRNRVTWA